jgi:hypothetical protein
MTPTLPAFLAVGALVALAVLVGVGVGRWWTRRQAAALADAYRRQLATTARINRRFLAYRDYAGRLEVQLGKAERIIGDLTQARLDDAAQLPQVAVPPRVWRALQEAREQWTVN